MLYPVHYFYSACPDAYSQRNCVHVSTSMLSFLGLDVANAVIAHEEGHIFHGHVHKRALFLLLTTFSLIALAVASLLTSSWELAAVAVLLGIGEDDMVRRLRHAQEFEADQYACKLGFGLKLIEALEKLDSLRETNRIRLTNTHPSLAARVARINKWLAQQK